MAQELLTTFEQQLDEVALVPGTGGTFDVFLNGEVVFSRADEERFPERAVRDQIDPERDLGHSDR